MHISLHKQIHLESSVLKIGDKWRLLDLNLGISVIELPPTWDYVNAWSRRLWLLILQPSNLILMFSWFTFSVHLRVFLWRVNCGLLGHAVDDDGWMGCVLVKRQNVSIESRQVNTVMARKQTRYTVFLHKEIYTSSVSWASNIVQFKRHSDLSKSSEIRNWSS